jgi:ribosome biogenesis GTPase
LNDLQALGWGPTWDDRFAPHAADGFPGRICAEHRELYHFLGAGGAGTARVSGRLRYGADGRGDFPAVGDWVVLQPAGGAGQAVIQAILPRANRFSRRAPGATVEEQVIAANLDTLFLVTSLNRDLNPRRIERYLAAAPLPGCQPVLLLSKSDLCDDPESIAASLRASLEGVPVHAVSAHTGDGLAALAPYLGVGRTVALVGSSGVGKSTLLNRLLGEGRQAVLPVRGGDDRGRHTTTRRELVRLPQGGLVIDNPGLREVQLWDADGDLGVPFADVADLAGRCRFADCRHEHEPGCAVLQAVADGLVPAERLAGFHKLRREQEYIETTVDPRAARERKESWKRIHRIMNKQHRRRDR